MQKSEIHEMFIKYGSLDHRGINEKSLRQDMLYICAMSIYALLACMSCVVMNGQWNSGSTQGV